MGRGDGGGPATGHRGQVGQGAIAEHSESRPGVWGAAPSRRLGTAARQCSSSSVQLPRPILRRRHRRLGGRREHRCVARRSRSHESGLGARDQRTRRGPTRRHRADDDAGLPERAARCGRGRRPRREVDRRAHRVDAVRRVGGPHPIGLPAGDTHPDRHRLLRAHGRGRRRASAVAPPAGHVLPQRVWRRRRHLSGATDRRTHRSRQPGVVARQHRRGPAPPPGVAGKLPRTTGRHPRTGDLGRGARRIRRDRRQRDHGLPGNLRSETAFATVRTRECPAGALRVGSRRHRASTDPDHAPHRGRRLVLPGHLRRHRRALQREARRGRRPGTVDGDAARPRRSRHARQPRRRAAGLVGRAGRCRTHHAVARRHRAARRRAPQYRPSPAGGVHEFADTVGTFARCHSQHGAAWGVGAAAGPAARQEPGGVRVDGIRSRWRPGGYRIARRPADQHHSGTDVVAARQLDRHGVRRTAGAAERPARRPTTRTSRARPDRWCSGILRHHGRRRELPLGGDRRLHRPSRAAVPRVHRHGRTALPGVVRGLPR